jgi:hypothetical protein
LALALYLLQKAHLKQPSLVGASVHRRPSGARTR